MTKPHAQRASITTGMPLEEVQEIIQFAIELDESIETQEDLIEIIEHEQFLSHAHSTADSWGIPFDHVAGGMIGGIY